MKFKGQIKRITVNIPRIGISIALNRFEMVCGRFLEAVMFNLFSRKDADEVLLKITDRRSESDELMNYIVEQLKCKNVSNGQ